MLRGPISELLPAVVAAAKDQLGVIYHAALPADWADGAALRDVHDVHPRPILAEEGFIHASYERQIDGVANRYYADVDELVLLVIDPRRRRFAGRSTSRRPETRLTSSSRTSTGRCPSPRSSTPGRWKAVGDRRTESRPDR